MSKSIEGRLQELVDRWQLAHDGDPVRTLGGLVCPVWWGAERAVLKVTNDPEERQGIRLLEWAGGRAGMVPALLSEQDAVLMPRLSDARSLSHLALADDASATTILIDALNRLHGELGPDPDAPLTPLSEWFSSLLAAQVDGDALLAAGRSTAEVLLADQQHLSLLHGDAHHGNLLLDAGDTWRFIDPKGLVGERTFDFVNLLRNPAGQEDLAVNRFGARVEQIARQGQLDRGRFLQWTLAFCSLSAVWYMEDGVEPAHDLRIARLAGAALGLNV